MRKILEISDIDIGLRKRVNVEYHHRKAARAVLKKNGLIALLHVSKHKYYKLPGGGVELKETIQDALKREILEETGCTIKIKDKIGKIIEHRSHFGIIQTSYCFFAEVIKQGKTHFDSSEIADRFKLLWVPLGEAIALIQKGKPDTYDGKFIVRRDLEFLKKTNDIFTTK